MKNYVFMSLPMVSLLFLGASCSPQTYTYENETTDSSLKEKTSMTTDQPASTADLSSKEGPIAVMQTSKGPIKIQLFEKATPKTVANFVKLAEEEFYNGTLFHRVIPDFMIQGGDPLTKEKKDDWSVHGTGGPGYAFPDEFNNHKNIRGRISMANSGPNTNGSQFFIITAQSTPWLDGKHAVFGEVIEGMDVVDMIEKVQANANDHPIEDVEIISVTIEK